jgi:hypothetical protein
VGGFKHEFVYNALNPNNVKLQKINGYLINQPIGKQVYDSETPLPQISKPLPKSSETPTFSIAAKARMLTKIYN